MEATSLYLSGSDFAILSVWPVKNQMKQVIKYLTPRDSTNLFLDMKAWLFPPFPVIF